jgi:hypothetical protein
MFHAQVCHYALIQLILFSQDLAAFSARQRARALLDKSPQAKAQGKPMAALPGPRMQFARTGSSAGMPVSICPLTATLTYRHIEHMF